MKMENHLEIENHLEMENRLEIEDHLEMEMRIQFQIPLINMSILKNLKLILVRLDVKNVMKS